MSELSKGWRTVRIEDVCEVNPRDRGPSDPAALVSFVPMPAVSDAEGEIGEHAIRPYSEVAKGYTRFRDRDVIFAKITPCMENGKIAIAERLHNGFACGSTEFHVLRCSADILPEYLWRFLRQVSFREDAERHMAGAVGQQRVPTQYLKDAAIPLPPLDEQRRIVARLDALFARSRRARAELERVPRLVERARQAVLAKAFSGDLLGYDVTKWPAYALQNIAQLQLGKMLDKAKNKGLPHPYLRNVNVRWFDFDLDDLLQMPFTANEEVKFAIRDGDILICEGGEPGRAAIWRDGDSNIKYQKALHRVRTFDHVKPEWIVYQLYKLAQSDELEGYFTGTTIKHLPQEALAKIQFLVPSENIQARTINAIEAAFARIDRLAAEASRATALLDRLEQATLAKAFRGELVGDAGAGELEAALAEVREDAPVQLGLEFD